MVSTPARLNRERAAASPGSPAPRRCWSPFRRLVILRNHGGAGRSRRTGAPLPGPVARPDDGACQRPGDGRGDRANAPPDGLRAAGRGELVARRYLVPRRYGERQPVGGRAGLAADPAGQRQGRCADGRAAGRRRLGLADGDDDRPRPGRAADARRLAGRGGRHAAGLAAAKLAGAGLADAGLGPASLSGRPTARLGPTAGTGRRLAGRGLDAAAPRRAGRTSWRLGTAAGLEPSQPGPRRLATAARRHHRSAGRRAGRPTGGAGERR